MLRGLCSTLVQMAHAVQSTTNSLEGKGKGWPSAMVPEQAPLAAVCAKGHHTWEVSGEVQGEVGNTTNSGAKSMCLMYFDEVNCDGDVCWGSRVHLGSDSPGTGQGLQLAALEPAAIPATTAMAHLP